MELYYRINKKYRLAVTISVIVIGAVLNTLLNMLNIKLSLPFFFDSIFTVMAAVLLGVIPSIFTGILTNLLIDLTSEFGGIYFPFAIVNISIGIITWLLFKKGLFKDTSGVLLIIIILSITTAFLGAIIATIFLGGITDYGSDSIVKAIIMTGKSVPTSAFLARLLLNIVDKGIAVIISFGVLKLISKYKKCN